LALLCLSIFEISSERVSFPNDGIGPFGAVWQDAAFGMDNNFTSKGLLILFIGLTITTSLTLVFSDVAGLIIHRATTVVTSGLSFSDGSERITDLMMAFVKGEGSITDSDGFGRRIIPVLTISNPQMNNKVGIGPFLISARCLSTVTSYCFRVNCRDRSHITYAIGYLKGTMKSSQLQSG